MMMPIVSLLLIVSLTNVLAITTDDDLSGTTINLLTERNTLVRNPAYWTELFYNETGIRVNLITMAQGDLHPEMMAAARDRVNYYDMFIYQGQRIPDYADCIVCDPGHRSLLEDLTDWVATEPDIVWSDIAYYLRSFVGQYDGRVYSIPLDGDVFYLYTNQQLLGRYGGGTTPPRTWTEFNSIAAAVHQGLQDANVTDVSALCLPKMHNGVFPWYMFMFIGPYIQSMGTGHGVFFDPNTFEPLLDNAAVREALRQMMMTNLYEAPNWMERDVASARTLFSNAKCAMTIDWGDIILLANKSDAIHGHVTVSRTPGSTQVWDRHTGQLRDCTPDLCPYAVNGVNYASFAASGGWVAAINTYSTGKRKQAAYKFLKLIGSQRASHIDVTRGYGLDMCRVSEMTKDFWIQNGFTPDQAQSTITAVSDSLTGPNTVNDLRIQHNWDYEHGVVNPHLHQLLAGNLTIDQTISNILTGWSAITDQIGRRTQLAVYRRTLGLPALSQYDCTKRGCDAVGGRCVADDTCLCNDGYTGPNCSTVIQAEFLEADSTIGIVILVVICIGAVSTIALAVFLVRCSSHRVVKAKSPALMLFVSVGLLLGYGSIICSIGMPTRLSCGLEPVLFITSTSLVLGVLVAKTYRIKKIFNNPNMIIFSMKNSHVLRLAGILALPNLILVVLLVTVQPSLPITQSYQLNKFWTCRYDLPAQVAFRSILLAYNFLILGLGVVFAFQTRHVLSDFNESKSIGDAVYVITFGTAIVFPLSFVRLDMVIQTSIRLMITSVSLIMIEILLIGKILMQYMFQRKSAESGMYSVKHNTNDEKRRTNMGSITSKATGLTKAESVLFSVPVMKSGLISSWTTADILVVPTKDMLAITTADSFGCVYKLSSIEIVKEPAANSGGEDAGGNVFEIKLGSTRWRIDGTQSQIWEFCKTYAEAAKTRGPNSMMPTTSAFRETSTTKLSN